MEDGVVGYLNDIETATEHVRVAGNPLVVRALEATGPNNCDVVIATADADRIRELARNQVFLAECRVMIVCNLKGALTP
jgi:hypothetical protein